MPRLRCRTNDYGQVFIMKRIADIRHLRVAVVVASIVCSGVVADLGFKAKKHEEFATKIISIDPSVSVSALAASSDSLEKGVEESVGEARRVSAFATAMVGQPMDQLESVALQDCIELFRYTLDQLTYSSSLLQNSSVKSNIGEEVRTMLSASLTNLDTCTDGFQNSNGFMKLFMQNNLRNLSALVSNALAIVGSDFSSYSNLVDLNPSAPAHNRRLLVEVDYFTPVRAFSMEDGFPVWMSAADRRFLQNSLPSPNVVVARDGSGNYRTITDALNAAPDNSDSRHVIHVKAGIYHENVNVSRNKTNLMLIGDGIDVTVVTGSRSIGDGTTTFRTATLAAVGKGFIARDMTFENTAGPGKHQAVALRVGSDKSALYRCSFKGYQDTLHAHSLRQFYRECDIYGTVDFIFGNAAVVIQNSNIFARKPIYKQKNAITAQGRTDRNQNTGISIQNCRVTAASDLVPFKSSFHTYLGRPYKLYSRTVYLQSFLDDLIDPAGWLEWSGDFATKTLYYGEFMNRGPGAGTANRVKWPGYRVIGSPTEASKFTVAELISGNEWLPSTGVKFNSGLSQ